ncbi:MAG: hypothetical protein WC977_07325 [Anaerovoracaceae bacterium]|jgi:hypothetical protein
MRTTDNHRAILRVIWHAPKTGREIAEVIPARELHEIYAALQTVAGLVAELIEDGLVVREDGRYGIPAQAKERLREEAKQEQEEGV